ncbi:MAG TPA: hypothetical protein PLF40_10585 [Kofleriaceae bacterium]|nr:hypothetical protein [Kofleriaceae bacterium]
MDYQPPPLPPTPLPYATTGAPPPGESLNLAMLAGAVAAALGAVAWATLTVVTDRRFGVAAIAVGALVGYAVHRFGRGTSMKFAVAAAFWAVVGCAAGNLLSTCYVVGKLVNLGTFEVLQLLLRKGALFDALRETSSAMDVVFYIFAVVQAFRFVRRDPAL